jgi:brefeldin A-resistance guanine nucleotide exchange factor 1
LSWLRLSSADHPIKLASEKEELKNSSFQFVSQCHPENLIVDSKYFVLSSLNELLNHIMQSCRTIKDSAALKSDKKTERLPLQYEEMIVFLTELAISIIMENKDRLARIWEKVKAHFEFLLTNFGRNPRISQRTAVGLLRITNRNLFRLKDEISNDVIQSLSLLFKLNPPGLFMFSRDIAFGLHDLLRSNAANVHEAKHWRVLFALLEAVGAAVYPDEIVDAHVSQTESRQTDSEQINKPRFYHERGYVSDDALSAKQRPLEHGSSTVSVGSVGTDWIHVSNSDINSHQNIMPQNTKVKVFERGTIVLVPNISRHDSQAFLKVTETLVFLVRDAAHVTPENFESCVQCLRSMIEASLDGGKNAVMIMNEKKTDDDDENQERRQTDDKKPDVRYSQASHQLLDITFTLHVKVHEIYTNWAMSDSKITASIPFLWENCWRPLLQAIARLCCDCRREIRMQALTTLQRAMLLPEFSNMEPQQWENCYADVLFPLLLKLLDNISPKEPFDVEETRVRAIQLISKVLLNHLNKLTVLPTFGALFIRILDFMRRYWNCERSELLKEAIPESLKNMILVLDNSGIFVASPELYTATLDGLKPFLPELVEEIMQNLPVKHQEAFRQHRPNVTSPISSATPVQSPPPSYVSPPIPTPHSPPNDSVVPSIQQQLPSLHPPSPPIMSPVSGVEQHSQMATSPSSHAQYHEQMYHQTSNPSYYSPTHGGYVQAVSPDLQQQQQQHQNSQYYNQSTANYPYDGSTSPPQSQHQYNPQQAYSPPPSVAQNVNSPYTMSQQQQNVYSQGMPLHYEMNPTSIVVHSQPNVSYLPQSTLSETNQIFEDNLSSDLNVNNTEQTFSSDVYPQVNPYPQQQTYAVGHHIPGIGYVNPDAQQHQQQQQWTFSQNLQGAYHPSLQWTQQQQYSSQIYPSPESPPSAFTEVQPQNLPEDKSN